MVSPQHGDDGVIPVCDGHYRDRLESNNTIQGQDDSPQAEWWRAIKACGHSSHGKRTQLKP